MKLPKILRRFNLAKETPQEGEAKTNGKSAKFDPTLLKSLVIKTTNLTQKDLATWRTAHQLAINTEVPRYSRLYDLYADTVLDDHLSGCIDQRKGYTMQRKFKITDTDGTENYELTSIFLQEWFSDLLSLALDSKFWGYSLLLLGERIDRGGKPYGFRSVELIPRKHVIPTHEVIIKEEGDEPRKGVRYREDPSLATWLIPVGKKDDLGLLLKCGKDYLSKKNMMAFWDGFGELFGAPMRIVKMDSYDKEAQQEMEDRLNFQGALAWLVTNLNTEIDIKGNDRADAFNVYDRRIDRCNSEISKAILGQTMTIDSGSSLSQSETHLEVFKNLCEQDATQISYLVNNELLPRMITLGFKELEGYTFEWDDTEALTPSEIREQERLLLQYYDIEPQYFIDKYNIPVSPKTPSTERTNEEDQGKEELSKGAVQRNLGQTKETCTPKKLLNTYEFIPREQAEVSDLDPFV